MSNNILNTSNSNTHQHLQHLLHSSNSSGSSSSGSNSNSNNTRFTTNNQQQQQLLFEQIQQQSKMIPNSSSSSTLSKKSSLSHMTNIDDAASAFAVHSGGSGGGGGGSSGGIGSPSSILKIHSNSNNNNSNNNNVSLPSLSDINWNNNSNSNPNINNSSANNNHHHHNHNHHHNHSHTHHSQSSQNSNNINNSSGGVSPLTNSHQSDYSSNSNSSSSSSNNKLGNIMDVPSSPEFSHLHQQQQQQQHHRSTTLSSSSSSSSMVVDSANVRLQQYEASIESLINQVQSAHDREQKQRSYTKSIEEGYANLESENLKLKKELFEMNKKLNEILQMKFSPQPTISAPTSSSSSNLPITSKFTSSLAVSGSLPPPPSHADKKKLELQQKKKPRGGNGAIEGDEELVAEALGSFVELTSTSSSRKPMLKRSNSEDSFRHNPNQGMSMMSPHAMIMASRGGDPTSSSMDWAMGNSSDLDDLKFKKRRSDQFMNSPPTEQPPAGTKTKKPPQFNPSSPPNLQRHHSFSINSPVKLESSLHSSGGIMELSSSPSSSSNQLTSSGGILKKPKKQNNNNNNNNIQTTTTTSTSTPQQQSHFPSQMQNIGQLPEMETDVDSTDEFDFKGSTGMPRSGDGDSPDSNENSRNSSSPIEAPMSDANLFKSIANDTPHEALLNEIHHLHQLQRESLEKMHLTQKQFLTTDGANNHDDIYAALQTEQKKLAGQIESELQTLNQMYSQTILEPNQLCKLDILLQDLSIQYKQLQLYQNELNYGPGGPELPVALVITKQPFPMVISKFKQLQEDHLTVQLLVGSNVDIISYSPIRAELIFHSKALTKGSATLIGGIGSVNSGTGGSGGNSALKKHIEKDTQSIDPVKGNAKFPIKFLTGTRKGCVKLHFVLQIKTTDGHVYNVPSSTSQPFIVITNDCQWEGSEGTLLKKESFNEKFEITWPHFVNILQKHFLKATKQSPIQPTRPLSSYDFFYLNTTFFGSRSFVSHKDFDQFWSWFGKSLQTLRYKRHISTLWQNGLIFMFLKRESINNILKGQEPGTFVILFSEMFPGQLEISYVGFDKDQKSDSAHVSNNSTTSSTSTNVDPNDPKPLTKIKHYLVQPNDTSGSKRTLPDFLNECPQFTHILQLNVSTLSHTESTIPPFRRELKNTVLEPYYSKRQNSQNFLGSGYDPLT